MSTTATPNYGLEKPVDGSGEPADVALINGNMDIIDDALDDLQTSIDAAVAANTSTNSDVTDVTTQINALQAENPGNVRIYPPFYKSGTEAVASSAVLQDDDDFQFTAEAGRTYYGTLNLNLYDPDNGGADFKCGFLFPSGRMTLFVDGPDLTFTHGDIVDLLLRKVYRSIDSNSSVAHFGVSELGVWARIDFYYRCDTAGTVKFRWCQNTSHSQAIKIAQDSHMFLRSVLTGS